MLCMLSVALSVISDSASRGALVLSSWVSEVVALTLVWVLCVDLFAGCGGSAVGLRRLGLAPWCYEMDGDCVESLRAAGMRAVRCELGGWVWDEGWRDEVGVMWASPPCQPFSAGGRREGGADERDGMPMVLEAVRVLRPWLVVVENVKGLLDRRHREYWGRWVGTLAAMRYNVGWKVLNGADYGLGQVRQRLFVVGRVSGPVMWPRVTHEGSVRAVGGSVRRADGLGGGLGVGGGSEAENGLYGAPAPWVTMAEALGWMRTWGGEVARDSRSRGNTFARYRGIDWVWERPSTTVSGDWRIHPPGHRANRDYGGHERRGPDALRLSVAELAVLQGLPSSYPLVGLKGSRLRQVGNACPPVLAQAVVGANLYPPQWPLCGP